MDEPLLDGFFAGCAIFVAVCFSIDWLLGEKHRIKMREKAGDFWLQLGEKSFHVVAIENIDSASRALTAIFGPRIFSSRRVASSIAYTGISTLLIIALIIALMIAWSGMSVLLGHPAVYIFYAAVSVPFSGIVDFWAIATTVAIYRAHLTKRWSLNAFTPLLGLVAVTLQSALVWGAIGVLLYYTVVRTCSVTQPDKCVANPFFVPLYVGVLTFVLATAVLPVLIQGLHLVLILSLKLFRTVLQPVVMVVLLRLQESEKGVLTNFALLAAAAAKLTEELIKRLT